MMKKVLAISLMFVSAACQTSGGTATEPKAARLVSNLVSVGHRGARGLAPENSLPGFQEALRIGVSAVELDVGVTKDGVVVVTHDQRINPKVTRDSAGNWLEEQGKPIIELTLAQIKMFDVGGLNPAYEYSDRYPHQKAITNTKIPTLMEVADFIKRSGAGDIRFDIEIKGRPDRPDETLPPSNYADIVVKTVRDTGIENRASILSFDWRILKRVKETAPTLETVCLTAQFRSLNNLKPVGGKASPWLAGLDPSTYGDFVPKTVKAMGCSTWSSYYKEIGSTQITEAHKLGLKVFVWTVNEVWEMKKYIDMGVDGIVTDYPDRLRGVMKNKGMSVPQAIAIAS